jgi:hypothetical protein
MVEVHVAGRVFWQPPLAFSGVKMVWESPGKCARGERERDREREKGARIWASSFKDHTIIDSN